MRGPYFPATTRDTRLAQGRTKTRPSWFLISLKHEARVQPQVAKNSAELGSPYPYGFKASSLDNPAMNLRDYLIRKRSVHQITLLCHCEQLFSAVLSDCHCGF